MNHQTTDRVSLEMARAIAVRLRKEPSLLDKARHNLKRWSRRNNSPDMVRCYTEWQEILDSEDLEGVIAILTSEAESSQRLRQNSPFAGVLTAQEVWQIKKQFATANAAPPA